MRHTLLVCISLILALSFGQTPVAAQVTAADSAAVLLQAAETFEAEGDPDVARALYRYIIEHFSGTPARNTADERLFAIRSQGTRGSGRMELQVWTTMYGLYLGVAIPGALSADGSEP